MANSLGFDLGEVYKTVETVKNARQGREINQFKMDAAKQEQDKFNAMAGIRSDAASGDVDAQRQLLTLDPKNGPQFIEAVQGMDKAQREKVKANIEAMGQLSAGVLRATSPEEKQRMYTQMRSMLNPEQQQTMPEQYNEDFLKLSLARIQSMDKILSNPSVVKFGNEDVMYQGGQEIGRTATNTPAKNPSVVKFGQEDILYQDGQEIGRTDRPLNKNQVGAPRELKSGDINMIMKMATSLKGGVMDEAGNIRGLNDEAAKQVQGLTQVAAELYRTGQASDFADAINKASQQYGVPIQSPQQRTNPSDPDNIRNFLNIPRQ